MSSQNDRRHAGRGLSSEQIAIIEWANRLGAITAPSLARRTGTTVNSARAKLAASTHTGLLSATAPLTHSPTLYTATSAGLRASGVRSLGACRVSAANAAHLTACASAAAALERTYPDHRVEGERELRRAERERCSPLASARLNARGALGARWHRPDLVLWPSGGGGGAPPTAVEVELTIKAPRRLEAICRAWARARCVGGVLYFASAGVEPALQRAIARARAGERIVVVPLATLLKEGDDAFARHRVSAPREASQAARTVVGRGSTS